MPELPEVETVVRGLRADVVGRTFVGVTVNWAREIVDMTPHDFAARLTGQQVESLGRRAKYIVFGLSDDHMLIHLKMSGRLYVSLPQAYHEGDEWLRVVFSLDDGRELRFSDARKFGRVILTADLARATSHLGPEPLEDAFTLGAFRSLIAKRSGTIKPLLLNQSFVAGIGNIYADEALWRARIDPRRKVDTLTTSEVKRLYQAIRGALSDGIEFEGASVSWYRKPDGSTGESQDHFSVYGREEQPCPRCGAAIHKIWLGQRGTHFCPDCQK